jgi:hypothetical protein
MFAIYNSISNLGALNLGSVVCILVIDQLAIRPAFGLILFGVFKVLIYYLSQQ